MLTVYRKLLRLYPAEHREQFGEEMLAVLLDVRAEDVNRKLIARGKLYIREIAGLMSGALREHLRTLLDAHVGLSLSNGRFAMRNGFRFPKATAVLMMIILAGIAVAIEKARVIQAVYSHGNPPLVPLEAARFTFFPTLVLLLVIFYAFGLVGWAILFALHRSGVHRLADILGDQK